MTLPKGNFTTPKEYHELRRQSDVLMEYIDGVIFMSPSPSTAHQRISSRLHAQLFNLLEEEKCEVFHAPFDIELKKKGLEGDKTVIPDLAVICDKTGLTEQKYIGVPTLIIEIISPSNQSHDLVTKLNIYMQYGVEEYWIINPLLSTIQLYVLNEQGQYLQKDIARNKGIVQSEVLSKFNVDVEKLFANI